MGIDVARKAALDALNDVLIQRSYADLAAKQRFQGLEEREGRFARKLLYQTLDKLYAIDSALQGRLDFAQTPPKLVNLVRMGACQLMYMDAVPDFAAVDSAVELAKSEGFSGRAAVVNAVLHNVIRDGKQPKLPDPEADPVGHLSVKYSWPRFVVELWLKEQPEHAEALLGWEPRYHATVRANGLAGGTAQGLEAYLKESEIDHEPCAHAAGAFRVKGSDLTAWPLFQDGRATAQGEASILVSRTAAAAAGLGATILDACAAPGGKSACIADALGGDCTITAWDVHRHRVGLMRETFRRLKVNATAELHDARFGDRRSFRFAIVDAPCSGLGVAWGSPDIKVSRRAEDIAGLTQTQIKILRNVSELVEVGGRLLYSTCTINRAENEDIAAEFLRRERSFRPCSLSEFLPPSLRGSEASHMLQLLPTVHGAEGFFLSLFQRIK